MAETLIKWSHIANAGACRGDTLRAKEVMPAKGFTLYQIATCGHPRATFWTEWLVLNVLDTRGVDLSDFHKRVCAGGPLNLELVAPFAACPIRDTLLGARKRWPAWSKGICRNNTSCWDDFSGPDPASVIHKVSLHNTTVFMFEPAAGVIWLNTGGWNTPTTRRRINEALHAFGINASVFSKKNTMHIRFGYDWDGAVPVINRNAIALPPGVLRAAAAAAE